MAGFFYRPEVMGFFDETLKFLMDKVRTLAPNNIYE